MIAQLLAKAKILRSTKLKRAFDLTFSIPALIFLLLVFLVIALAKKLIGEELFFHRKELVRI